MHATDPAVGALTDDVPLGQRVRDLEDALVGQTATSAVPLVDRAVLGSPTLVGALALKAVAGQINTLVHVCGITAALPWILEPDEVISYVSLGAGTGGGKAFDLETSHRIAEFKFTQWQGPGGNSACEQGLLADIVHLAEAATDKHRYQYVLGASPQLALLKSGKGLASLLKKKADLFAQVSSAHPGVTTIGEYWSNVADRIELVDLHDVVPEFGRTASIDPLTIASMTTVEARERWPDARPTWHAGWVTAYDVDDEGQPALVTTGAAEPSITEASVLTFTHPSHRRFYAAAQGWLPTN